MRSETSSAHEEARRRGSRCARPAGRVCHETGRHPAPGVNGRIDVLINNAGSNRINKPPEETSLAEWKSVIDTNIAGTFLCCHEAGKVMIVRKKERGLEGQGAGYDPDGKTGWS
ncbi:MAG: hypothetical protein CME05_15835 [Gemmatimonadaceae bacterium]|nr:hypothetical protein [Gemmatimonadaceae bacterium]